MRNYHLIPRPLTQSAFADFGDVIEVTPEKLQMINDGNTECYCSLSHAETTYPEDRVAINLYRAQPRPVSQDVNMRIEMMERHPLGSQAFYPLSGKDYLVLVADPVETIHPDNLHLFRASAGQGINYHTNTWHHPVLALDSVCDFLVVDRSGKGKNHDEFFFKKNINIEVVLEMDY